MSHPEEDTPYRKLINFSEAQIKEFQEDMRLKEEAQMMKDAQNGGDRKC